MAYLFTLDSVLRLKGKGIGTSLALSLLQHNSKRHSRYFTLKKMSLVTRKTCFLGFLPGTTQTVFLCLFDSAG